MLVWATGDISEGNYQMAAMKIDSGVVSVLISLASWNWIIIHPDVGSFLWFFAQLYSTSPPLFSGTSQYVSVGTRSGCKSSGPQTVGPTYGSIRQLLSLTSAAILDPRIGEQGWSPTSSSYYARSQNSIVSPSQQWPSKLSTSSTQIWRTPRSSLFPPSAETRHLPTALKLQGAWILTGSLLWCRARRRRRWGTEGSKR